MGQRYGILSDRSVRAEGVLWALGFAGLFLFVFTAAALFGPGRIDIVDGQTRYEVARSLVDYGDGTIRDPRVWFGVFPGRSGRRYTNYRFPQSVLGVGAIWISDATGPQCEGRRHFVFTLTSALAGALLALAYAAIFRSLGHTPTAAFGWAMAGIFCTPNWFYATSTFDDILGTTAVMWAVAAAFLTRNRHSLLGAAVAGLMMGLAFNCKQPLGAFVAVAVAANLDRRRDLRRQWGRISLVLAGLALGVLVYKAYDLYKFPHGWTADHAPLLKEYVPVFPGNPLAALLCLSISPGAGVLWYCPTFALSLVGAGAWRRREKGIYEGVLAGSAVFVLFLSTLTIFKGDPSWGPRYLTPVLALWWLFVPAGAAFLRRRLVHALLALGLLVQLAGLSVDPHRLYFERDLSSAFGVMRPWSYFQPALSHIMNRPREMVEICVKDEPQSEFFTPAPAPTFALPVIDDVAGGPEAVRTYGVLNSLRPWWASQRHLPRGERPVDLVRTAALLGLGAAIGLLSLIASVSCLQPTDAAVTERRRGKDLPTEPSLSLRL
jgi:hypothetical protein